MQPEMQSKDRLNYKLAGSRLINFECGLTADLKHDNSFVTPYYTKLVFAKGDQVFHEFFPGVIPNDIGLTSLGQIVEDYSIQEDSPNNWNVKYFFANGTWLSLGWKLVSMK